MNPRIQELAEQAYQWAVTESKGGQNVCAPGSDYFLAMEKKKFAELIVRECADIGERYADGNYEVRNQILIQFGLEEPEE
jgi:hypothetical protein